MLSETNKQSELINKRHGWSEALRLVAVSLVLISHFWDGDQYWPGNYVQSFATVGVIIFLLISGYYEIWKDERRTLKFGIKTIYWTILGLIIYSIMFWCGTGCSNPWEMFISGKVINGPYCSWYYIYAYLLLTIFMPLLDKFIKRVNKYTSLGIILTCFLIYIFWTQWGLNPDSKIYIWYICLYKLFFFAILYCIGAWISWNYKYKIDNNKNVSLMCGAIAILTIVLLASWNNFVRHGTWDTTFIYSWVLLFSALSIFLTFASFRTPKSNGFNNFLLYLGTFPLGIYLTHDIFLEIFNNYWISPNPSIGLDVGKFFLFYIIAIGFAIICSTIVYLCDKQTYKFINKIKNRKVIEA